MATPEPDVTEFGDLAIDTGALLGPRLHAAEVDVLVTGLLCLGLLATAGPLTETPHWAWKPAAAVLGALSLLELLTGITPGKWLYGLTLRNPGGMPARRPALLVRGLVRQAPLAIFVGSLFIRQSPLNVTILFLSFVIACCYVSGCYILFMRIGQTLFDAVAGTRLARRA
ncbi:MAG TPA: RDD family protein [Tepidisphaeraceae bacterium]|jgi:uncharacterized RDD family membrane protein YckC|nr:RDD family protein [Tepidisphaeraceae bacterium]